MPCGREFFPPIPSHDLIYRKNKINFVPAEFWNKVHLLLSNLEGTKVCVFLEEQAGTPAAQIALSSRNKRSQSPLSPVRALLSEADDEQNQNKQVCGT